jgi:arsenate reductase-like glutaredoxin family protein
MLYAKLDDPFCGEIITLLEKAGVNLRIHDLTKQPLNSVQISRLIRHNDVERFLNPYSKPYKKNKLGMSLPSRQEVIDLIAGDNDLFRVPIVVSGSMISVGYDPRQIAGMLQLKPRVSEATADESTPTPVISRVLTQES